MGRYLCKVYKKVELHLDVDHENDISLELYDDGYNNVFFLDKTSAQKLANELNQLLMEGKGNE